MTDRPTIDPQVFIARCQRAQRRGALAIIRTSTVAELPAGARFAFHPGGYVESELDDAGLRSRIQSDARVVVATGRSTARCYHVRGGVIDVEIAAVVPAPRLFVFGAGELADAVVDAARVHGWDPVECSHAIRSGELAAMIDASDRAAAIVVAIGDAKDGALIETLVDTSVRYIGVVGPHGRIEPLLERAADTTADSRIHAPVGADIATEPPRVIASAVVAEARAVVSGAIPIRPTLRRMAVIAAPESSAA